MEPRLRALRYRAHHRGTREADFMIGGFFDANHDGWSDDDIAWFERLLDEQDVDIMAWAIGAAEPPERFRGPMLEAMRRLDYVTVNR